MNVISMLAANVPSMRERVSVPEVDADRLCLYRLFGVRGFDREPLRRVCRIFQSLLLSRRIC